MSRIILLIIILLILLIFNNTINNFGNIYDSSGNILNSDLINYNDINTVPIMFKYTTPESYVNASTYAGTIKNNVRFYKWPLLYLIDSSQITEPVGTYDAAYFNDPTNGYTNMTMEQLLNIVISPEESQYNGPDSLPNNGSKLPNLINLTNLLGNNNNNNLLTPPNEYLEGVQYNTQNPINSDTVATNTSMFYMIPANNDVIVTSLTIDRNYVLGIAPQLNINRLVDDLPEGPSYLKKRFGQFKYADVRFTNTDFIEGSPGVIPNPIPITFEQILI